MNNFHPNQSSGYVNVVSKKRTFNVFSLALSLIALLAIVPYWIGLKQKSAFFIIDKRLDLNVDANSVSMFFLHLIATVIALSIFVVSGAGKALADRISYLNGVIKIFEEHKQKVKIAQDITKGLVILIVVVFSYLVIIELLRGMELPIFECNVIFLSYILGHIIWNIEKKTYDVDKHKNNFDLNRFNKTIPNIHIFKNIDGEIKGELKITPNFISESHFIKLMNQNKNIATIIDDAPLKTIIDNALSDCDIDNDIEQRRLFLEIFKDKILEYGETSEEIHKIKEKTSSVQLTKKIEKAILEKINREIKEHPFSIKFSITKDTVKEKLSLEIEEASRKSRENTEVQRKELVNFIEKTISETSNPIDKRQLIALRLEIQGLSNISKKALREIQSQALTIQTNDNHFFTPAHHQQIDSDLVNSVEKSNESIKAITEVLYGKSERELQDDDIKVQLSGTSVFVEKGISIEQFLEVIIEKWKNNGGERTKESYKQLIGEVLFLLSKNQS